MKRVDTSFSVIVTSHEESADTSFSVIVTSHEESEHFF